MQQPGGQTWNGGAQILNGGAGHHIVATHYTNDPHLKLDQTKCNTAVYIINLLTTPPKMVHDSSGQCSLRKMYIKQMFVLVRMQLRNLVNT